MLNKAVTKTAGFTLIELVITLAVVGVLAGIVAPSFVYFIKDNRMTAQINNLIATVHTARAEAATRRSIVTLCATTDASSCNTTAWEKGWILFTDATGNASVDTGDEIIRYQQALEGDTTLRESGFSFTSNGRVTFNTNGFLLGDNASSGTLTLCDDRGADEARAIVINVSGTSRLASDQDSSGIPNDHNGTGSDIACP